MTLSTGSTSVSDLHNASQARELNKLRLVFEQTPSAIFILDREFRFEYVNPGFTRLSGYAPHELIGHTVASLFYHKDLPESRKAIVETLLKGQKWEGELLTHNKNGSTYWANTVAAPYTNERGEIDGYVIIQQDVSDRKAIEQALLESEAKYKTLVENSHDGIMIVRDGIIRYANDTLCNMLGYCIEQQTVNIIFHEDRAKMLSIGERRRNGDTSVIHEFVRLIAKDGEVKMCETTSTMIQFNGEWAAFYSVHDVTERNRFEEALSKSEKRYRELADMLPLAVYELDAQGNPTYMNRTGLKLLGIEGRHAPGKHATSFFSPNDLAEMKQRLETESKRIALNGEEAEALPSPVVEYTAVNADGKEIPVLIYGTAIVEDGRVVGSRGVIVDISERKAMENALRESEEKYKTLIENSQNGIFAIEGDKILFANRTFCKMIGFSTDELYHQSALSLVHPDDKARGSAISERRREGDRSTVNDIFRFVARDGSVKECDVFSSVVDLNQKNVSLITVNDLSELRRIQAELEKSEVKYRELADFMPQTIFELNANGDVLYINKTGMTIFDIDEGFLGRNCLELFVEDEHEALISNMHIILKGGTSELMYEYRAKSLSGRTFPVLTYSLPVVKNGLVTGLRGMVLDISERKATEIALLEKEKKYRELAEMLPQTVYELDLNANLRYLNKAGRDKFGTAYETSDVSVFSIVVPDQLERMKTNFTNVSFNNKPSKGNFYKLRQADGQIFEAMISATPMLVDGKTVGSRGVVIDITDHVNMQKALAESEEKYRTVIENATDGIVIVQNEKLMFLNESMCNMVQYSNEELIGSNFLRLVPADDQQIMVDFHARRMAGEAFSVLYRSRLLRKDGKILTIELNARTSNYNGAPASFIVVRDISDRILIEEELQLAKNELEKLNTQLEKRVKESSKRLTEARTQLINLQKENLQSQYDVLKQQVNPHFLFNSLNVLTSLIKLEPDLAEKFSEQLSKVYRYVLENKDNDLIDLNTELNFLEAYIFLLNIRFVDKVHVTLNIPDSCRSDKIIPLAMQLLIENAIKHNVMSKLNPLVIEIFVDADNYLFVINNLQERPSQIVSTGVGLKNILNRYELLNLEAPAFEKTDKRFIAKIKLIKSYSDK